MLSCCRCTNFSNTKATAFIEAELAFETVQELRIGDCGMRNEKATQSRHAVYRAFNPQSAIRDPQFYSAHTCRSAGCSYVNRAGLFVQCSAMQIFVKNNMQWFARPFLREEISAFLNHQERIALPSVFAHANYLINLAATNPQFHANSIRALTEELIRADQLELPFLVLHPGAHLGAGEKGALTKIVESIDSRSGHNSKSKNKN